MHIIVTNRDYHGITLEKFSQNMHNLGIYHKKANIAVAVSGGADSMCLAFLLQSWCKNNNINLIAFVVNHNLRLNSLDEAKLVSKRLKHMGIKNKILHRSKVKLQSKIQEIARQDRYQLLKKAAKKYQCAYLCVGHHLDDQIETMILRNSKGTNIIGGSGMSAKIVCEEVIILRPMLNFTKNQILHTMEYYKLPWVNDPSNDNSQYERVRVRKNLVTANIDCKQKYITTLYENYGIRSSLESKIIDFYTKGLLVNKFGLIKFNLILFNQLDIDVRILVLGNLVKFATGENYTPKINKILNVINEINMKSKYSLGNAIIQKKGSWFFIMKKKINIKTNMITNHWDKRFLLDEKLSNIKIIDNTTKNDLLKDRSFKSYFKKFDINMESIDSIPWIYKNGHQTSWSSEKSNYYGGIFYIKNSLLMNKFVNI